MGLSSKMVSSDGLDWKSHNNLLQDQAIVETQKPFSLKRQLQQNQQQQQQQQQHHQKMEQLKCPRCDSANTKFCYYNNYNKSQPRHFCKSCKRHWTKGGTLRNVPVGGGRKNKRPKTSSSTTTATTATTSTPNTTTSLALKGNILLNSVNNSMTNQACQQIQGHSMPLASSIGGDDRKEYYEILSQAVMCPPYPISQSPNSIGFNEETVFDGSITVPLLQDLGLSPQNFPFLGSSTSLIETSYSSLVSSSSTTSNSSTSRCSSSNVLCNNNSGRDHHFQAMSDSTITSVVPTTIFNNVHREHQQATWNLSNSITDMSGLNWNWDDIDTLVSTNNPNMSWDNNDSEIKP